METILIVHYQLFNHMCCHVLKDVGTHCELMDDEYLAEYVSGNQPPNYPVPAVECGAHIQAHIVDIITPRQSTYPSKWEVDWVSCDELGYVWSVAHWWNDQR